MNRIALGLAALASGCALTGPAPGGPLHSGAYTQVQPTFGIAYGPASAEINGVRVSGDGQSRIVTSPIDPFPNPVPVTVGVRQQFGRVFEASADVGWVDSGVELRMGVPSGDNAPIVLSAGARTGKVSAFGDDTYQGRIGAEAYPRISRDRSSSLRLVLSLGLTAGNFEHQILLPSSYAEGVAGPGWEDSPVVSVVRREVRLESAIGLTWAREHFGFTLAVSPWILLAAAEPASMRCQSCSGPETVTNFSQSWGLALLFVPSFGWGTP